MSKYKVQVEEMLNVHKDLFEPFKELHDKYAKDPKTWQEKFNEEGQDIIRIIKRWENNLCSRSEAGKYGVFSSNLSSKFWDEVRTIFPKIDFVGIL